jgi:hypothetical protein
MEVSGQPHVLAALFPGIGSFRNYWTGSCLGPSAGLDVFGEEEVSLHSRGSNPAFRSP